MLAPLGWFHVVLTKTRGIINKVAAAPTLHTPLHLSKGPNLMQWVRSGHRTLALDSVLSFGLELVMVPIRTIQHMELPLQIENHIKLLIKHSLQI